MIKLREIKLGVEPQETRNTFKSQITASTMQPRSALHESNFQISTIQNGKKNIPDNQKIHELEMELKKSNEKVVEVRVIFNLVF